MAANRPSVRRRRSPSRSIARAIVGWLESAAPLVPGADRSAAPETGPACSGTAGEAANRRRLAASWIAK